MSYTRHLAGTGQIMAAARARGPAGPSAEASASERERPLITPDQPPPAYPAASCPPGGS